MKKLSNILTVLVAIVAVVGTICLCGMRAQELRDTYDIDTTEYKVVEYEVAPNDTLWNLGQDLKQEADNLRAWIDAVKDLNQFSDSGLQEGDIIQLYIAI